MESLLAPIVERMLDPALLVVFVLLVVAVLSGLAGRLAQIGEEAHDRRRRARSEGSAEPRPTEVSR